MTQFEIALSGKISPEMNIIAEQEHVSPEFVREGVAAGTIVIPVNVNHELAKPCGIGAGLRDAGAAEPCRRDARPGPALRRGTAEGP